MGGITNILLLILFISFFHSNKALVNSSSDSGCIESERKALLEFKASIFNDSSSLSSWTGRNCCSWHGITCDDLNGHVLQLNLGEYGDINFNSPLSPWLFNLTHLQSLTITNCGLRGFIPTMFDKLTSLTYLDLSRNSFGYAFPDSLCSLTSLTHISLSKNHLQGSLPSCLGNLTSLSLLELGNNELSGEIPAELGFLTQLNNLDLSFNHFKSSIPSNFGHLEQLTSLILENNLLSGPIPSTLGDLSYLMELDVADNFFIGELSDPFFEGFASLETLSISRNHFLVFNVSSQWIPPRNLQHLDMNSVLVGTQFPPWIQSGNFQYLSMSNTSISGVIPNLFLTASPQLRYLDLSRNLLTGPLPSFDMNENSTFQILQLSGNQISGNISEKLCKLTSLKILSLSNNKLTGRIPLCLGNLHNLTALDLGNNSLSGHIPSELSSLASLVSLHLNGNKFFVLPSSFKNLTLLRTLDLGDNELQGSIPEWIGLEYLPKLQFLRLESNQFSGEISVNLCQLPSLQILNLADNNLSGTIPRCLGNLSMMLSNESGVSFNLSVTYNEEVESSTKGMTMEYSSSLLYAKFISLSTNHFHGEIPAELMDLKGLQSLNLSNNELTGRIPENIGDLKDLESFDLSKNLLSGTIPQSLATIDALSYLNLSFNNLEGRVPLGTHFDTLYNLSIYQGNKELCGKLPMKSCPGDDSATSKYQPDGHVSVGGDEFDQLPWLYAGIGPGFAVGFLGVICILYFKHPWRIAYFGFVDNVYNKVWVTVSIKISQLRGKFN